MLLLAIVTPNLASPVGKRDSDLLPQPPPGGPWAYAHFKVLCLKFLPVWVPKLSLELLSQCSHAPTCGEDGEMTGRNKCQSTLRARRVLCRYFKFSFLVFCASLLPEFTLGTSDCMHWSWCGALIFLVELGSTSLTKKAILS